MSFEFMAGHKMSHDEIAGAWLAFRELRRRKLIWFDFLHHELNRAEAAGWQLGLRARTREQRYIERMTADPYDFFRGYEWGVDVNMGKVPDHRLVFPHEFAKILESVVPASGDGIPRFTAADVSQGVRQFIESKAAATAAAGSVAASPTPSAAATVQAVRRHESGSVLVGLGWMILMACVLFWLPVFGPFLAGLVGGKKSGSLGKALVAALLPAMMVGVIAAAIIGSLSGLPLLAIVAGLGTTVVAAASVGALLLGAVIGGLIA